MRLLFNPGSTGTPGGGDVIGGISDFPARPGRRIRSGEYAAGEKLPTLRELSDLYSVSVSTIQRALELTRERGLTVGRAGAGVYVAE